MLASRHLKTPSLEPLRLWQALLELSLIALVAWLATSFLHDFSDQVQLSGVDTVQLTRAADFAGQFLRESGKIPLWNPFIGNGEPMLEATQSFILNPLMSLPIMLLGAKPGVLVVVILHAIIFGWGGWVWGRVMGFSAAGRLLMGGLLVSSGSFTGAISHGVFQLAMSQAYVPNVYAGLIAMLFLPGQRWGLTLFVTATALLIFSGSFWYVLPTAFGCALLAGLALLRVDRRVPRIDGWRFRRLLLAGVLVLGVAAVRLLTVNRELLLHPQLNYDIQLSYTQVLTNYFDPGYTLDKGQWFAVYHYVVPLTLMLGVTTVTLVLWRRAGRALVGGWRVLLAGVTIIAVMSFFGTGPTLSVMAVYEAIPFLKDWRQPGRMAAVSSIWVVMLVAWGFDLIGRFGWALVRQPQITRKVIGAGGLVALGLGGAAGVIQVSDNWFQSVALIPTRDWYRQQVEATYALRDLYPHQMIALHTGWIEHYALNETRIRHPYGDNEVFTTGLPPTIGGEQFEYWEEFAYGDTSDSGNGTFLRENGWVEMDNVPTIPDIGAILDYNPEALPYAYVVPEQTLLDRMNQRLVRSQTRAVSYFHRIDEVELDVENTGDGNVLVAQETAYPGWSVMVNGVELPIESVHRRIAVRLPANLDSATVIFRYQPVRLYMGGLISFLSIVLLGLYALRLDLRWHRAAP